VESRGSSVGKIEEWYVKSWHHQGCKPAYVSYKPMSWPPRVSIERTDCILVYGPSKLVTCHRQKLGLSILLFWLRVGEKLDGDPQIDQPTCWGCSWQFLFLGSSEIRPNLSVTCERLLCFDHVRYVWSGTIRGLSVGCAWRVGQVSPAGYISI
jgi:hypothetical protein